ncbi:hypothetical protein [Desulfosporosinus sp.]|uniref:hypothetical protein n=1 Tax=Desulfosporosinus sp. TaxID=157907 RepID=UPI0025BB5947|nr:hypothetical protein [Desulfosporosinus sp.]MBC2721397.1 hypothetical protein [Desulfosporosinus sp.]MBC2728084.1 hypothetical protein [Desulfosporosinus sp.]
MRRQCLRAPGTLGHPWPADVHYHQCAMDGAFGTIVSSGDYRRRRVLQNKFYRRRMNPAPQSQELERLVCSAS